MITLNKEKLKAIMPQIKGHIRNIFEHLQFYGETGLHKGEFEKALKRIEITTNKSQEEIKQFIESQPISYADLDYFACVISYRRFPNEIEVNLIKNRMWAILQQRFLQLNPHPLPDDWAK